MILLGMFLMDLRFPVCRLFSLLEELCGVYLLAIGREEVVSGKRGKLIDA
jgi:hypothetical protein